MLGRIKRVHQDITCKARAEYLKLKEDRNIVDSKALAIKALKFGSD